MKTIYFLKTKIREVTLVLFIFVLFALLFYLMHYDWIYYRHAFFCVVFFLVILWALDYLKYQKEATFEEKFLDLKAQYNAEKQQRILDREEMREYFLTWNHQMKTPIASMRALFDMDIEAEAKKRGFIFNLHKFEQYTNMAMAYLKLADPGKDLDIDKVNLDELLQSIFREYRHLFIYSNTTLAFTETKAVVLTDASWLRVMLEQFLTNSLKYASGGRIDVYMKDDTLIIEDDGSGILPEDLPRIFEKGYAGFNGRMTEKSTGLGLFLADIISKRLQHPIHISSEAGQWTRVAVSFTDSLQSCKF